MAGEISVAGLSSGLPIDDMITKLVEAEKYRLNNLEKRKLEYSGKIELLTNINTKMDSVTSTINVLKKSSSFYSKVGSSSNSDIADIAVDNTADLGSYEVEVASSSKHILAGKGWIDQSTTAIASGAGTFSFDDGEGNTISVAVDATTTLSDLQTLVETEISNQGSNAQVEIFSDESSANPFRMKIISGLTGSANSINITQDDTDLSFDSTAIDSIENIEGTPASLISSTGTYTGHVNKRLDFEIISGGDVGTDEIEIKWTDPMEDKSGTITVNAAGDFEVLQGVSISIGAGTLTKGDKFGLDLYNPNIQLAQDTGLAKNEKEVHNGFSDLDSSEVTSANGVFSYQFAGEQVNDIQVAAGTTLSSLKDLINTDPNNPGVTATIVNDGSGTANAYHLVLSSTKPGAANKIENISHTLDNFSSTFTETQKGTNSLVKINNYPSDASYLQNNSNLITDIVDGASLTLKSEGTTNLTISNDNDSMVEKVNDFVVKFNEAMDYINEITEIKLDGEDQADSDKSGDFVGNSTVQQLKSELQLFITRPAIGFDETVDKYSILAEIGVSLTGEDGKIELDEDKFNEALNENPERVVELFSANKLGSSSSSYVQYGSALSTTEAGKYSVEVNFNVGDGSITSARYKKENESTWHDFAVDGNNLTALDGEAKGLSIDAIWDGSSATQTAEIRIRKGKALEFYDDIDQELLSDYTGITKDLEDNYDVIINSIDKQIFDETRRVGKVQERLKARFARMEVVLQQYQGQMEQAAAQISSLGSVSS